MNNDNDDNNKENRISIKNIRIANYIRIRRVLTRQYGLLNIPQLNTAIPSIGSDHLCRKLELLTFRRCRLSTQHNLRDLAIRICLAPLEVHQGHRTTVGLLILGTKKCQPVAFHLRARLHSLEGVREADFIF